MARASTHGFYEDQAEQYARLTLPQSMAPQLSAFLSLAPAGPVLDLGCGAGRDLTAMVEAGRAAFGLDLSRRLALSARAISGAPVVVANLRRPPFSCGQFAGVWASASLLHLPREELPGALAETARILKIGGVLFTSVKAGRGERLDPDGRWFVLHEASDWERAVEQAGYRIISLNVASDKNAAAATSQSWINCLAERV